VVTDLQPGELLHLLETDLTASRAAHIAEREHRPAWQEQQTEQALGRIRSRDGFATLTTDQSHSVLRPIALAVTDTTEDAVAPSLDDLETPFLVRLEQAEESADDILDGILSAGRRPLFVDLP
jgi:hypothetical protein